EAPCRAHRNRSCVTPSHVSANTRLFAIVGGVPLARLLNGWTATIRTRTLVGLSAQRKPPPVPPPVSRDVDRKGRRTQPLDVLVSDPLVHVLLVPVLGVRPRGLGPAGHPGPLELWDRCADHRIKLGPIYGAVGDLGSEHDLPLVEDRLGVVALHVPDAALEVLAVGVGQVHFLLGDRRRREVLRRPAQATPVGPASLRPKLLIRLARAARRCAPRHTADPRLRPSPLRGRSAALLRRGYAR